MLRFLTLQVGQSSIHTNHGFHPTKISHPDLLDLPNELLVRISIHLSDIEHKALFQLTLANKRLNQVTAPLLVRVWPAYNNPQVRAERLVWHLVDHPELLPQIRHLHLEPEDDLERRPRHARQSTIPGSTMPRRRTLRDTSDAQELFAAGRDRLPGLRWLDLEVRRRTQPPGVRPDVLGAVLLLASSKLTSLDIWIAELHRQWLNHRMEDKGSTTLRLVSQVARQIQSAGPGNTMVDLPLSKLKRVCFHHWGVRGYVPGAYAAPFFYLPEVKSFTGVQLNMWEDQRMHPALAHDQYVLNFPIGTSSIEHLVLKDVAMSITGLFVMVMACRRLKSFSFTPEQNARHDQLSSTGLAQVILHHAASLEELFPSATDTPCPMSYNAETNRTGP